MAEKLSEDKDGSLKKIKRFGIKMGLLFFCLSIIMGATMIIPIEIASALESLSSKIANITNSNTGHVSFYISMVGLALPIFFYIKGMLHNSSLIHGILVVLFLSLIIFSNTALFYKDWLQPNFRMDGQQGLGLIALPFKTSWIYLVVGYVHDVVTGDK